MGHFHGHTYESLRFQNPVIVFDDTNWPASLCEAETPVNIIYSVTPDTATVTLTDNGGTTLTINTLAPGNYAPGDFVNIVITADNNGCTESYPLPGVGIVAQPNAEFDILDRPFCQVDNQPLNLDFVQAAGTLTMNGEPISPSVEFVPTTPGEYTITNVLEAANCVAAYSSSFEVFAPPLHLAADIQALDTTVCLPEQPVIRILGAEDDVTYTFFDAATGDPIAVTDENFSSVRYTATLPVTGTGDFSVEVQAERSGCLETLAQTATLSVLENAGSVDIASDQDLSQTLPTSTTPTNFFAQPADASFSYAWRLDDEAVGSESAYSRAFPDAGSYTLELRATTPENCVLTDEATLNFEDVFRFVIPNVFTPNGDGINDRFVLDASGVTYDLEVYDRHGRLVYSGDDSDQAWDGREVPEGVYTYRLEYTSTGINAYEGTRSGTVTLLR